MSSNYNPGTFSGGIPSGTALTQEFADIKTALDATIDAGNATGQGNGMSGDLDMNGNKLLNLAEGTNDTDAVTKKQLDDAVIDAGAFDPSGLQAVDANHTSRLNDIDVLNQSQTNDIAAQQAVDTVHTNRLNAIDVLNQSQTNDILALQNANLGDHANTFIDNVGNNGDVILWDGDEYTNSPLAIDDLDGVTTAGYSAGDVLTIDAVGNWSAQAAAGGSTTLQALTDTNITGAQLDNAVLEWDSNAGNWIASNQVIQNTTDIGILQNATTTINDNTDVNANPTTDVQVLGWNATSNQWVASNEVIQLRTDMTAAEANILANDADIAALQAGNAPALLLTSAASQTVNSDPVTINHPFTPNNDPTRVLELTKNGNDGLDIKVANDNDVELEGHNTLVVSSSGSRLRLIRDSFGFELHANINGPNWGIAGNQTRITLRTAGVEVFSAHQTNIFATLPITQSAAVTQPTHLATKEYVDNASSAESALLIPFTGVPSDNTELLRIIVPHSMDIPAMAGVLHRGNCGAAPTGSPAAFTILKNGVSFATVSFAAMAQNGVVTAAALTSFVEGDIITVETGAMNGCSNPTFKFTTIKT